MGLINMNHKDAQLCSGSKPFEAFHKRNFNRVTVKEVENLMGGVHPDVSKDRKDRYIEMGR